jgi:hypothetical protein
MPEHGEQLFQDLEMMLRKLKKPTYEANMDRFRKEHGQYLEDMICYVERSEDTESAISKIANAFADDVQKAFSVKGKINGRKQADMNFFMIYYVFPAILLAEAPCSERLCDGIRDVWNSRFKGTNINYTTYDRLHDSFRNKIFGIF